MSNVEVVRMNPEAKAQWVAALRSGKYQQGNGALAIEDEDGIVKFCCLGVLCDALGVPYGPQYIEDGTSRRVYNVGLPDANSGTLPDSVCEQVGLMRPGGYSAGHQRPVNNPNVLLEGQRITCLAELNDNGTPFSTIADIIEEQL